jgi:hypothetical protein
MMTTNLTASAGGAKLIGWSHGNFVSDYGNGFFFFACEEPCEEKSTSEI